MTDYEKCSDGEFYPSRESGTGYGWGVRHARTSALFALVGAKGVAFGLSAALNGHLDAAKVFIGGDAPYLDDAYLKQFVAASPQPQRSEP